MYRLLDETGIEIYQSEELEDIQSFVNRLGGILTDLELAICRNPSPNCVHNVKLTVLKDGEEIDAIVLNAYH